MIFSETELAAARTSLVDLNNRALSAERDSISAKLSKALSESKTAKDGVYDLTKTEELGAGSSEDRLNVARAMHLNLTAHNDEIRDRHKVAEAEREIKNQPNLSVTSDENVQVVSGGYQHQPDLAEMAVNALQEDVGEGNPFILNGKEIRVDDPGMKRRDFMNVLFQRTDGWEPESVRDRRVELSAQRPVEILDVLPTGAIRQDRYVYMEETVFNNNVAEVAEGAAAPEAELQLTERSIQTMKLAVAIPVTEEQLEDVDGVQDYLQRRLNFMMAQRLDERVVSGTGAGQMRGLVNISGIPTSATTAAKRLDDLHKMQTAIRTTDFTSPNVYVLNPNDWEKVRLTKTTDGVYLYGSPSESVQARLWGLTVAQTSNLAEGTGLCADINQCQLMIRRGVTIAYTDSHDDEFMKGIRRFKLTMRVVFPIFRPNSFYKLTNIDGT